MRRYRVAIVGFGIGRQHAEAFAALPDRFEIAAVVDLDAERRAKAAAEFAVAETTAELDAVLGRDDIDIIDLCTPPATHLPFAEAALAAGQHVICEKPLVGSLAECDRLAAAATRARGVLMPVFQCRWGNGARRLKRVIEAGAAGRLYLSTVEVAWTRGAAYYAVPWRGKLATELGGCLTTHAIHAHDLLRWLVGDYAEVFCRTATRANPIEVEDCAAAAVTLADGSLASFAATLGSAEEITRLRLCFEHLTAESGLAPYHPGGEPWRLIPRDEAAAARIDAALEAFVPGPERFAGQFAALHQALEAGAPPPVTLADARASLELLTALYHSGASGEAVALPLAPSHPRYGGWTLSPARAA